MKASRPTLRVAGGVNLERRGMRTRRESSELPRITRVPPAPAETDHGEFGEDDGGLDNPPENLPPSTVISIRRFIPRRIPSAQPLQVPNTPPPVNHGAEARSSIRRVPFAMRCVTSRTPGGEGLRLGEREEERRGRPVPNAEVASGVEREQLGGVGRVEGDGAEGLGVKDLGPGRVQRWSAYLLGRQTTPNTHRPARRFLVRQIPKPKHSIIADRSYELLLTCYPSALDLMDLPTRHTSAEWSNVRASLGGVGEKGERAGRFECDDESVVG